MSNPIAKSIAKNTSIMTGQYVITSFSTFLLMMFLPRYLGPVEYGRYFLAATIVGFFMVFVEYGGTYFITKSVSRDLDHTGQIIVDANSFRFIFSIIAFVGAVVFGHEMNYPPEEQLIIFIFGFELFWNGGIVIFTASFQGHEKMQYTSAGIIAETVFKSLIGITALLLGAKAKEIAIVAVISNFLKFSVLAWFSKKIVVSFPNINWKNVQLHLKEGVPYFFLVIFGTIYYKIDSLMLSKMTPELVVGWYGGAYRLFLISNSFPSIFTTAVFPILSKLWGTEGNAHKLTTQRSLEFMILFSILVSIVSIGFAKHVVQLLYGLPAYEPSIIVFQVLALGVFFLFADMIIGTTLMTSNKQHQQSILAFSAIPVNIGLNYFLIPYYQSTMNNGGIGAGIATVLTEFFIMLVGLYLLPKGLLKGFRYSVIIKGFLSGFIVCIVLFCISLIGMPWYINAAICVTLYPALLFLFNTFEPAEQNLLLGLFKLQNLRKLLTGAD